MDLLRGLFSPRWRWLTLSVLWLGVVVLAQFGLAAIEPPISVWDRIYMIPNLFTTGFSNELAAQDWRIQVARFVGPLVFASTFLVATAGVFREQLARLRLRFARGHVVVAGIGDKGSRLAISYAGQGRRVAALDSDPADKHLVSLRRRGITTIVGDVADPQTLRDAGVPRASLLVSVCGDDATNAAVLEAARALPRRPRAPHLSIAVHLVDPRLARLLRTRELAGEGDRVAAEFFNLHQRGARMWLTDADPFRPDPAGRSPHLVVVGLGPLGGAVAAQAVQRWHAREEGDSRALTVTVADADASGWLRSLTLEQPGFAGWALVRTIDLDPASPAEDAAAEAAAVLTGGTVTDVFVALDDEAGALSTALLVRQTLGGNRATIHVQTRATEGLASLVTADHHIPVRPFALYDRTCTAEAISGGVNEQVAIAIHDDYLRRATAEGRTGSGVRPWEQLSDADRQANRKAAAALVSALQNAGYVPMPLPGWDHETFTFPPAQLESLAAAEHERWMRERIAEGWRHGPERDDKRKLNPALVPWAETPEVGRQFNRDYVTQVPAMLARSGFALVRIT